jgi:ABC-2 type transport system permease protein
MTDVQAGNVEVLMNKPISYLTHRFWWSIGSGLFNFILIGLLGFFVLFLIIGIPESMKIGLFLPTLLIEIVLTSVLTLLVYGIIGMFSFWIEDINPIFWIIDKFVMILGGSYLPVALFPPLMYKIAIYSPFGASMFISHIVYDSWKVVWLKFMGLQFFWIIVLGIIIFWLFRKAQKKLSVNGG